VDERQTTSDVLVIDDEEDMCWALRLIIQTAGRGCISVNTAAEAIRIVTTQPFRLAFVDVKLPDMNGFDLVRCLQHQVPGLPCVLVSGFLYHDDVVVREGLQSGLIAGFVGKPFLLDQIQAMLDRFTTAVHAGRREGPSGNAIPLGGIRSALEPATDHPKQTPPKNPNSLVS
jgi:two-component system, NtrC family, response regulator